MMWLELRLLRMARGYLLAWTGRRRVWCTHGRTPLHGRGTVLVVRDEELAIQLLRVAQRAQRPELRADVVARLAELAEGCS